MFARKTESRFYKASSFARLLGVSAGLTSLFDLAVGPIVIWLTESLPAVIRCSGVAVVYAVSIAIFGGTTQFGVTWLIRVTGSPLAPAWYWTVAAMVGLAAMWTVEESAPRKLASPEAVQLPLKVASSATGPTSKQSL